LRIGYPHFEPKKEKQFRAATCVVLDAGLGELAFALEIQHIEVVRLPSNPVDEGYYPLTDLPEFLGRRRHQNGA
jgi:hypothetical protein